MATIIDELLELKDLIENPESYISRERNKIATRIRQALDSTIPDGSKPEILKSFSDILTDIDYNEGRREIITGIKILISDILDAQHCNGRVNQAFNITPRTRSATRSWGESSSESGSISSARYRPQYSSSGESGSPRGES